MHNRPASADSRLYEPIKEEVQSENDFFEYEASQNSRSDRGTDAGHGRETIWISITVILLVLSIMSFTAGPMIRLSSSSASKSSSSTLPALSPPRLSWHNLTLSEKQHYIDSVQCLVNTSYASSPNRTYHDVFAQIHSHIGSHTYENPSFLPWHRYFLHTFESTLRSKCDYSLSGLVYWDWSLDHEDLTASPVFDPETGFGGDGDPYGEIMVGDTGRCVRNGPFKDLEVKYYNMEYSPHCLTRGFRNDAGVGSVDGSFVSPWQIDDVLRMFDYGTFVSELVNRVEDSIPFGIGGDFDTATAPYDPLYMLHLTNLDRLWYLWQHHLLLTTSPDPDPQWEPSARTYAYTFPEQQQRRQRRLTRRLATVESDASFLNSIFLDMMGLAESVSAMRVMDTEGGCKRSSMNANSNSKSKIKEGAGLRERGENDWGRGGVLCYRY